MECRQSTVLANPLRGGGACSLWRGRVGPPSVVLRIQPREAPQPPAPARWAAPRWCCSSSTTSARPTGATGRGRWAPAARCAARHHQPVVNIRRSRKSSETRKSPARLRHSPGARKCRRKEPVLEVWDVRLRTPLPNLGASVLEHWGAQPRESQGAPSLQFVAKAVDASVASLRGKRARRYAVEYDSALVVSSVQPGGPLEGKVEVGDWIEPSPGGAC